MKLPTGFLGALPLSTMTCDITVHTSGFCFRRRSSSESAVLITEPITDSVSAVSRYRGSSGTAFAASSFLSSSLPTCGPFPCVTTIRLRFR